MVSGNAPSGRPGAVLAAVGTEQKRATAAMTPGPLLAMPSHPMESLRSQAPCVFSLPLPSSAEAATPQLPQSTAQHVGAPCARGARCAPLTMCLCPGPGVLLSRWSCHRCHCRLALSHTATDILLVGQDSRGRLRHLSWSTAPPVLCQTADWKTQKGKGSVPGFLQAGGSFKARPCYCQPDLVSMEAASGAACSCQPGAQWSLGP